jgi:hypothetical protein
MSYLSDVPSKAIRQALADLDYCEHNGYRVNMRLWHTHSEDDGVCEVCLAGATLAREYGTTLGDVGLLGTFDYPEFITNKHLGLDAFRVGRIWGGVWYFRLTGPRIPIVNRHSTVAVEGLSEYRWIPQYSESAAQFKDHMCRLVDDLAGVGL